MLATDDTITEPAPAAWRRLTRALSGALLLVTALAAVATAVAVTVGHVHFARVLTESMAPDVTRGDALVLAPMQTADVKVGQVVLLPMPGAGGTMYSHRVTSVQHEGSVVTIQTKGDANSAPDPWVVHVASPEVERVVTTLPLSDVPILQPSRSTAYVVLALLVGGYLALRVRAEVRHRRRQARARAVI